MSLADRSYTITYDAGGRAVNSRSPGGVVQTYKYDEMGSLEEQAGSGAAAATATRTFDYDLAGRMTSFSAPTGTNTIAYDDRGLPTTISGPSGNSSFAYTPDGMLAKRTDAAGVTDYGYDTAARLKTLNNSTAGTALTYEYDVNSAVKKITYGAGNTRTFGYDGVSRLTSDELKTGAGASIGKIEYGWDANSNETSKTTTGFGGATIANTYTYDHADRLTSWNNGNTAIGYTYDGAGNRTGNGSTTYTYDARNRLVSDSTGVSYAYTPRGTLATSASAAGVQTTTSDAFDQVITQSYGSGSTKSYTYDALARAMQAGHAYAGTGNDLAADATAGYVRDPGNDVVGTVAGTEKRLVWTDLHDDIVGQFTATGTALSGSAVYDPLGAVKSKSGMLGSLGYQSEWTETATGRVNMAARWYNTGTGQFDSRDTMSNSPVPDSVNANRYQYGNANPLTNTDPSGHFSIGGWNVSKSLSSGYSALKSTASSVGSYASKAYSSVSSYASQTWSYASSYASYQYHRAAAAVYKGSAYLLAGASTVAKKMGLNKVADYADKGRKKVTKKANYHHKQKVKKQKEVERKGQALKQRTVRAVSKAVKVVKDAHKTVVKFVAKHKKTIITIAAVAVTVVAVATLGPVGGVLASIAVNVAKDALLGDIHSLSDLGNSLVSGAISGTIGALTGGLGSAIGGKAAAFVTSKVGAGILGRATAGATGGGVSGGVSDAADQLATTGRVNLSQTAQAAAFGAVTGGVSRRGSSGGCRTGKGPKHSFDPETRVLMADGSAKPIGEVELGDEVLATEPETGETAAKPVSVLHHHQDTELTDVTVTDEAGNASVLETTANHPFWNATTQKWTDAADLKVGDKLRSADGETTQTVAAIRVWTGLKWMDDLTVNDIHTYYVLAGTEPALVHNNNYGFDEDQCPVVRSAKVLADATTSYSPAKKRPGMAEAIQLQDGNVIAGTSKKGEAPALHPQVQSILDSIPIADRSNGHGRCGYVQCVSTALNAGLDVRGASAAAFTVGSRTDHPSHGKPVGPCSSCQVVSETYDNDWETF